MNALTYLTRRCHHKCDYCRLRDSNLTKPELHPPQWAKAFKIMHDMGVRFNLILGNETWLLGSGLKYIMDRNRTPYALYTTAPQSLFGKYHEEFFRGSIDNLSCGVDWGYDFLRAQLAITSYDKLPHDKQKAWDAWQALQYTREVYPKVDCQGTITVHKKNLPYLWGTVNDLARRGIFIGVNFIHWDKDRRFDFFPPACEITDYMFTEQDEPLLLDTMNTLSLSRFPIQNREMLEKDNVWQLWNMQWHCCGDPYGGPTVDADGSLRCCGYRRGEHTPQFSIFDLPEKEAEWREAVYQDADRCPGCGWSYPWMYKYWLNKDPEFGQSVFVNHAAKHLEVEKWSKRKLEG